ncbi:heavy-metal-associated domain-containing protein [Hypericibacter sp.]|uniref:heavy-metal-associated domain-containing protein n=1 Tax=Hypericibacter sp. TaxID=2705401 RepID=UPI003D6CD2AB
MLKFKVDGMNCGHCAGTIRHALSRLAPESAVAVDLDRGEVSLAADLDPAAAIAAMKAAGYEAAVI